MGHRDWKFVPALGPYTTKVVSGSGLVTSIQFSHLKNGINILICHAQSSVMSDSLRPHGLQLTGLLCPWDFPGKNTGVGCPFLLQGVFPAQGLNLQRSPALAGILFTTETPGKLKYIDEC